METRPSFFMVLCIFLSSLMTVECLNCYQCSSMDSVKNPYQCNEFFEDSNLVPESCDNVYNAQYCVKQIGRFEGILIVISLFFSNAACGVGGIKCFHCDSAWDISCTDVFVMDGTLQPQSCDRIFDAQYCVKRTDGLGTKRYCSAIDFGNYCNYVRQPGDQMEYRSCYFTCSGDGCNSGMSLKPFQYLSYLLIGCLVYSLSLC